MVRRSTLDCLSLYFTCISFTFWFFTAAKGALSRNSPASFLLLLLCCCCCCCRSDFSFFSLSGSRVCVCAPFGGCQAELKAAKKKKGCGEGKGCNCPLRGGKSGGEASCLVFRGRARPAAPPQIQTAFGHIYCCYNAAEQ